MDDDTSFDLPLDTSQGDNTTNTPFDYTQFYKDYGNVGGTYDPASAPTEKDVLDAINTGTSANPVISKFIDTLGNKATDFLKKNFYNPETGAINLAGLGTAAMALYGATAPKTGAISNQKPIPVLTASRQEVQYNDPNRRPGEQGRQYFTDTKYDGTSGDAQAQGILAAYKPASPVANPYAGQMAMNYNKAPMASFVPVNPASNVAQKMPLPHPEDQMAHGGIAALARGGRYLSGVTDGMADKISTSIDGKQPAALSHGEFVIPADVVSHLGNGNSDAGANKLYEMMARVRKARTGNPKQGKQIDANHFMPGGLARYAAGGDVLSAALSSTPSSSGITPDKTVTPTLAPYASDYITTALGQGAAAADAPRQVYKGPLTAGPSDLQQQSFAGISDVAKAGYNPTTFTSNTFGAEQAQQYMNPYLKNVLDPQMAELKRQNDIKQQETNAQLTKAGAFGGSRQAIMNSENDRNLLNAQNVALGQGYSNAYDKAMGQFNTEQGRGLDTQRATEASRQYSSEFGLKSLADLAAQGNVQRGITSAGIDADKAQFEEQRDYPMKAAQYKLNLLQGIPVASQTVSTDSGALGNLLSQGAGLSALYKQLSNLGVIPK